MSRTSIYLQAEQRIQSEYQDLLEAGKVTPASSLVGSLNFIILFSWLLVCGSLSETVFRRARVPVFAAILANSVWNLLFVRSVGVVGSIGVGINSALCVILAANFVLIHDPSLFKRLVLRPAQDEAATKAKVNNDEVVGSGSGQDPDYALVWQSMPRSFWLRSIWTFDLITSFRGIHWSWSSATSVSPSNGRQWLTVKNLQNNGHRRDWLHRGARFLADYLLIDLLKCIMIADPYFVGLTAREPSPPDLSIQTSLGLHSYRSLLATIGVWLAIDLIFSFVVLLQINPLSRCLLGLNALPEAYPPIWGTFNAISQRGLRGFWGETWHQLFRMHFVSVGNAMACLLLPRLGSQSEEDTIHPSSPNHRTKYLRARLGVQITTVFVLSGAVHACASFTMLGHTTPWRPFLFFAIQPLGMAIQAGPSVLFNARPSFSMSARSELVFGQLANCVFTFGWLWACAGLFFDDVASGGIWMLEPIPFSLIRGLGLSDADSRFWCW